MKKFAFLLTLSIAILFSGCNSKREYFEPEQTHGDVSLSQDLPSAIKFVTSGGATLKNGSVITKNGIAQGVKLADGYALLAQNDDKFISANVLGDLNVSDASGNTIFTRFFPTAVVAASLDGNLLAAVSAANHIYLVDIYEAKTLMEYKSSTISAIDSRVAAPIFLSSIIVYPSLDGKIYIANKSNGQLLRDIVVSSENFFNNITYLEVVGDYMIAATAKRVIVINPSKTTFFDGEIKDVLVDGDKIFIFQKDGKIVKTDFELNRLAENYFKFAIFSDAIAHNNSLYIVEKTGYVIKTDLNLENAQILELNDEITDRSFMSDGAFYYDDEFVKFE